MKVVVFRTDIHADQTDISHVWPFVPRQGDSITWREGVRILSGHVAFVDLALDQECIVVHLEEKIEYLSDDSRGYDA